MSFNILAPGVVTNHYTFGLTKIISDTINFNVAAMYAPNVKVTGTDLAGTRPLTIDMTQYAFEMSLGVKF